MVSGKLSISNFKLTADSDLSDFRTRSIFFLKHSVMFILVFQHCFSCKIVTSISGSFKTKLKQANYINFTSNIVGSINATAGSVRVSFIQKLKN